jgi:MEDS: MEthanogen/methylotroph, DcmR Sensory domain
MATLSHITRCGLWGIDQVPFGMHACHFYSNRDQLVAALVPYVIAGLCGNERCLWAAAPPLPAREAVRALRAAWDGADDAAQAGALRILDFDHWYASAAGLRGLDVVELWLEEEKRALAEGYNGLRIAGNASFPKPGDWSTFIEYQEAVTARFNGRRIVALCSYARAECNEQQMSEVTHAHHCAFEAPNSDDRGFSVFWALRAGGDLIETRGESEGDSDGYNHSDLARRRVRPGRAAGDVHRPGRGVSDAQS